TNTSTPPTNTIITIPSFSKWFSFTSIHNIEHQAFPEIKKDISFSNIYIHYRNTLINTYQNNTKVYLTITYSRKLISCNLHMLIRIHSFLEKYCLINYKVEHRYVLQGREDIKRIRIEQLGGIVGINCDSSNKRDIRDIRDNSNISNSSNIRDNSNISIKDNNSNIRNSNIRDNNSNIGNISNINNSNIGNIRDNNSNISIKDNNSNISINDNISNISNTNQINNPTNNPTNNQINNQINTQDIPDFTTLRCGCGGGLSECCYYCDKLNIFICGECYDKGIYPMGCVSDMFIKYSKSIITCERWSLKEELLLLEGIEKYEDDWNRVSEYVGTKSMEQCVLHFLKMPISDDIIYKNIEMCKDVSISTSTNPIMSVIAFICSCVHPSVASEASKWAIQRFSDDIAKMTGVIFGVAGYKAMEQKCVEEKKVERLLQVLVESQIKKMELKIEDFKVLCGVVEKERSDLNRARDNYRKEIEAIKEKIVSMRREKEIEAIKEKIVSMRRGKEIEAIKEKIVSMRRGKEIEAIKEKIVMGVSMSIGRRLKQ
ncbi:SWIRM domain-containing protein, partial [Hamiltosporidium tvaerminnensis]